MVGQTVGKYRVLDRIGRGGMGTVYRAMDEMLHRDVAIKVLNAELNDPEVAKRFRAEAITVARLSHPGIATIYELFEHEGEWLMVMEFVRGETLEGMVSRMGPLSAQRAAELCMQALAALAHAHSMGVVHRDLKPANLMITENGTIKVMDFGIARVTGSEHLTNAGFMMGTPAYMAPEQVRGGDVDARADLYAMGVVFYRLTTASLPFKGDTAFAMAQSQVNDPPTPIGTIRTDLPGWADEIVARALAKLPEQRFQSAAEFHEALARCLAGIPLSSMYASSEADTMITPGRAMPTGAFMNRPMPTPSAMPSPSGPYPYASTGSQPTVAAPGTSPGMIAGASDPTVAAPSGATERPMVSPVAPGPASAPAQAGAGAGVPAKAAARKTVVKKIPVMWIGVAAAVVIVAVVGIVMMLGSGGPIEPPALPEPTAVVEGGQPSPTEALGLNPAEIEAAAIGQSGANPPATAEQPARGTGAAVGSGTGAGSGTTNRAQTQASTARPTPAPTPPSTPPVGRAGAAAEPPASGATPPAPTSTPAADPLVTFTDVKLYEVAGKRATDKDAVLNFVGGQLMIMPSTGGVAMATLGYKRITHATYVHARDPKWSTAAGLAVPPDGLDMGSFIGSLIRTSRHWLVLQGPDHFEILRLDDNNFTRILATFEQRTGVKVDKQ